MSQRKAPTALGRRGVLISGVDVEASMENSRHRESRNGRTLDKLSPKEGLFSFRPVFAFLGTKGQ